MFRRVLACWAMDALTLRRTGLDRPSVREVDAGDAVLAARVERVEARLLVGRRWRRLG